MTIRSAPCSDARARRYAAAAVVAALVTAALPAAVHADAKAEAQVMFDRGVALFKAGKFVEACSVLEASVERFPGVGNRGKLAECYERVGRLASAWALYREVADAAKRDRDARRESVARQRVKAIEPRVPKITVTLSPEAKGQNVTVTRDGRPVAAAELGLPVYVDAGKHKVTAIAPGQLPWLTEVEAVDGKTVTVEVPALDSAVGGRKPAKGQARTQPGKTQPGKDGDPKTLAPEAPLEKPVFEPGSERAKELAQSLVAEGVALLEKKDYQPALDRFVGAYDLYPTPKLLLNMATTLREMGRLSDAADMYQAFIESPGTNAEFVGEAKQLLNDLDRRLYLLGVRIVPKGSDVSIDGGPWISVGDRRLLVRLTPGIHMVRSRKPGFALEEMTVNAFEGERNDLELALKVPTPEETGAGGTPPVVATGKTEGANDPTAGKAIEGGATSQDGKNVIPILSKGDRAERGGVRYVSSAVVRDEDDAIVGVIDAPAHRRNELGLTAQLRIDGGGRGAAAAFGLSFSPGSFLRLELDLTFMVSKPDLMDDALEKRIYGAFIGARYRILTHQIRPVVGIGVPTFYSDGQLRIGGRAAAGAELVINRHLAVVAEAGYEHFFNAQDGYDTDVFVPLVQITGRL